jgi:hypothetical protein
MAAILKFCNSNFRFFIYGCGICATGVPCESGTVAPLITDRP